MFEKDYPFGREIYIKSLKDSMETCGTIAYNPPPNDYFITDSTETKEEYIERHKTLSLKYKQEYIEELKNLKNELLQKIGEIHHELIAIR